MRILYVGTELAEAQAQAIATAVNSLGERVTVSWTSGLDQVENCIDENDGLRVLVVAAQPNEPVWRWVLTYAARLPAALPLVVIVPEEIASDLQPLARGVRADLELKLAQATATIQEAAHLHQSAMAAAAEQLARRQSQYEMGMARAAATRDMVNEQFREAAIEVERVRLRHASVVADAERTARREAELAAQLEDRRSLAGLVAERQRAAEQRRASAMTAAAVQSRELQAALSAVRHELASKAAHLDMIATREAQLTSMFTAARTSRETLEEQIRQERAESAALAEEIADAGAALAEARRENESAAADVARRIEREASLMCELAERQAHFGRERAEERETRDALEQEVARAGAALQDEQERHHAALATAAAELAERQTHFDCELAEAEEKRGGLTAQLREMERARDQEVARAATVLRDEQQRHDIALGTAVGELAERQAHFDRERAEAEANRSDLTAQLREVEEARDQARCEHQSAADDVTRLTEREAALEARLKEERETRDTLEQEVAAAARYRTDIEARVSQANEEIEHLQQALAGARTALLVQAAQFDEQRVVLKEERERLELAHTAASAAIQQLTAERQDQVAVLATRENDIAQLRNSLRAGLEQLEVTRRQREVMQAAADQLPGLHQELQKIRADNHRLFQQGPLPMFRCTKDGVLIQANRMLTILLGHRSHDELRGADWAAAVFESPNDLSWLIERCLGSRGKESTETAWRRKDGSRLLVRLSACGTSSDLIEAGVEDLTPIRVLNDRLSQAHRMEAVGRLSTEVAVTCGSLLGSVHQNAQQLLMTGDSNSASSHRGKMLLDEISRAAGLLRQLAAYGDEERRKPAMVELRTVVRDVAPVLKRVAGDDVEVQLPRASDPLNIDAGAERVQRLLVNLAAYGRERMPLGGRLKIELGRIVVDRHFAAKHPNVRLGPHALVTVTESRRATRTDGPLQLHDNKAVPSSPSVAVQTGVDLGTLQELVAECGGHLWMTVEPVGDMVVKIRLPLVSSYGEPPRRRLAPGSRVRTLGHWLHL